MSGSSGGSSLGRCNAKPGGLLVHNFELGQIVFVEIDGRAGECFELERAAHVVDVGVGNENLLQLETKFGEAAVNATDLLAGIDDDRLTSLLVAEDGAVALQWAGRGRSR